MHGEVWKGQRGACDGLPERTGVQSCSKCPREGDDGTSRSLVAEQEAYADLAVGGTMADRSVPVAS